MVLDILGSFTLFATDKKKRRSKVICRYRIAFGRYAGQKAFALQGAPLRDVEFTQALCAD